MENKTISILNNEFDKIPFVDVLLNYTESFLSELEKLNVSIELVNKFHKQLLQELSLASEVTLQEELEFFKINDNANYELFVENTNLTLIAKYPVLDTILKRIVKNYLNHLLNIFSNFSKDFFKISKRFSINTTATISIIDIDASLGDGHSGESTALVTLSDGTKLIYKPRNIETSNSYNLFIDWVNQKLETNLKTLKCLSFENYGWLEFVTYDPVNSYEELENYYYEAGILLAVTLLLGSKDCHYENIIASGAKPVIIDHETIVQPVLSNQSIRTWDEQHKIPFFSVLESMLIVNHDTGVPLQYAGFGVKGNIEVMDLEKQVINPNTINSKRDTRFVFRKLVKDNIPFKSNNIHVFANEYKNEFIKGFEKAYDMFFYLKEELMSPNSPVHFFDNLKIRYVWRPTFVYFRILKYMRGSSFMSNFETQKSKLYELMSKAYKKDNFEKYKFILESEMEQMLNGDIPFFELSSLNCHFEEDKTFNVFKYNCIKSIKQRLDLLSMDHKKVQVEYISRWLKMNTV